MAEIALAGEIWELPDRLFYRRLHGATSRVSNPSPEEYTIFIARASSASNTRQVGCRASIWPLSGMRRSRTSSALSATRLSRGRGRGAMR